jgi:hypothetical protein
MTIVHEKMKDNIFNYDGLVTLAFCDLTGAMSGDLMKAIGFRRPKIIEDLKTYITTNKPIVGSITKIDNYVFVFVRKHYANKVTAATIAPMIPTIIEFTKDIQLKAYSGDFPMFAEHLNKIANLTWCSKCDWPWS